MGEGWIPPGFHKKCHNLDRFLSSDLKRIAKFKSFKFNHPASCSPPRGSRPYSRHSSASLEITKMISTQLFFHWCSYTILIHFSSSLLLLFTHHYSRCFSTLLPPFTRHFRNQKMSITQPFLHGSIAVFFVSWPSRKCGYENIHNSSPARSSPILLLLLTRFTPAVYPLLKKPLKCS